MESPLIAAITISPRSPTRAGKAKRSAAIGGATTPL
jgi:hypothetical protein